MSKSKFLVLVLLCSITTIPFIFCALIMFPIDTHTILFYHVQTMATVNL